LFLGFLPDPEGPGSKAIATIDANEVNVACAVGDCFAGYNAGAEVSVSSKSSISSTYSRSSISSASPIITFFKAI